MHRLLFLSFLFVNIAFAQSVDSEAKQYERAVAHLEAQRYAEAIPLLQAVLKVRPDDLSALWSLGIAHAELKAYREALSVWQRMQKTAPGNVRVASKVMQAHQSLGELDARDKDRETIFSIWRAMPESDRKAFDRYCREQFVAGDQKVFAFEYFEPKSPNRVYFRFSLVGSAGEEKAVLVVASSDLTTKIAQGLGEIGPEARAYHLDRYEGTTHGTYAHFNTLPTYDAARSLVIEVLAGKRKAISSSAK